MRLFISISDAHFVNKLFLGLNLLDSVEPVHKTGLGYVTQKHSLNCDPKSIVKTIGANGFIQCFLWNAAVHDSLTN